MLGFNTNVRRTGVLRKIAVALDKNMCYRVPIFPTGLPNYMSIIQPGIWRLMS